MKCIYDQKFCKNHMSYWYRESCNKECPLYTEKLNLFYGGHMSQWAPYGFTIDNTYYNCAEQYMMAEKAMLFRDVECWGYIMRTNNPELQKAAGRGVKNYDEHIWRPVSVNVVYLANLMKYLQNELTIPEGRIAEASPTDLIWGIGLGENDPEAKNPENWNGLNMLGEILERVREQIKILKNS